MNKNQITIVPTPSGYTEEDLQAAGSIELYLLAVLIAAAVAVCVVWRVLNRRRPAEPAEPTDRTALWEK